MKIGLDLDGTVYTHPEFFKELVHSMSAQGHEFYCISSHSKTQWFELDVPRLKNLGFNTDLINPELMHHVQHGDIFLKGQMCNNMDYVFDDDLNLLHTTKAQVFTSYHGR